MALRVPRSVPWSRLGPRRRANLARCESFETGTAIATARTNPMPPPGRRSGCSQWARAASVAHGGATVAHPRACLPGGWARRGGRALVDWSDRRSVWRGPRPRHPRDAGGSFTDTRWTHTRPVIVPSMRLWQDMAGGRSRRRTCPCRVMAGGSAGSQSARCGGGRPDAPASSTRRRCSACRATRKASMASSTRSHSASRLAPKARSSSHTGRRSLLNVLT